MIIIAGVLEFTDQVARDAAVAASIDLQQAPRDEEPGCQAYCFAPDPCQPNAIQVYELWDDEASLAAHFQHENYVNMGALLRGSGLTNAVTSKYRCDLTEPVYDDSHTARADFFTEQG